MSSPHRWRWGDPLEPLRSAVEAGAILAIPTESSYALAVDPRDAGAVEAIFRLKGRRQDAPLPVVVGDRSQIASLGGRLDDPRLEHLASLWPAALSLLVSLDADLPAAAGSARLAVRVPAHARLRELLLALGRGLTATSANRSGEPALTSPTAAAELLAGSAGSVLVDDGRLPGGNPSTLVGVRDGEVEVVRPGAVPIEDLATLLGVSSERIFSAASVEILADESR